MGSLFAFLFEIVHSTLPPGGNWTEVQRGARTRIANLHPNSPATLLPLDSVLSSGAYTRLPSTSKAVRDLVVVFHSHKKRSRLNTSPDVVVPKQYWGFRLPDLD